jgi:hypothetical protein
MLIAVNSCSYMEKESQSKFAPTHPYTHTMQPGISNDGCIGPDPTWSKLTKGPLESSITLGEGMEDA